MLVVGAGVGRAKPAPRFLPFFVFYLLNVIYPALLITSALSFVYFRM